MRKVISNAKTVEIEGNKEVCIIDMGRITQIRYMHAVNRVPRVKRIDKEHYIDLETHEIKEYKKRERKSRVENIGSLRRTFSEAKQIINANFEDKNRTTWVTLTYNTVVSDDKEIQKNFDSFIKSVRRKNNGTDVKYIFVLEFGANGGIHIHCLLYWDKDVNDVAEDSVRTSWKHGDVCIKQLNTDKDILNIGSYLTAYIKDMSIEEYREAFPGREPMEGSIKSIYTSDCDGEMKQFVKNARLELYRPGFKIFRHSINMNMPTKKYDTYDAAKKKLDQEQKKCVHSNAIKVTDNYDLNIFVQYETYQ